KRRPRPAAEDDVNPWDMAPRPAGYLSAFYQTTLRVMFGAGRFFAHLDPEAPQLRALLYALIITLIMLCSQYLWLSMSREMLEQAMPADAPLMVVIRFALDQPLFYSLISLAIFVFQIYLGSALLFLCFRMTGVKHATFYIIFQVVAYSTAPLLLCIIPVLGQQVGSIWCLACLVNGCRMALRLDWPRTLLGFAPLVLLFIVMLSSLRLPY
ncbi:YIP1 family protein, partial [uncultured Desulfovibrio sp.]